MKRFRLRVLCTVLLAAALIVVFGWIVAWQNYRQLSREAAKGKRLTLEVVDETLNNLSRAWTEYKKKLTERYEVEAVFASLALQNVIDDGDVTGENRDNGIVVSIQDQKLTPDDPAVRTLGLDASLFQGRKGSFAAPGQPTTLVVYSRIGNTPSYFVKWIEDTVLDDVVRETVDIPGILKWTEITYDVPAIFISCDPDSGKISEILYKNNHYFSDCESLEDLGLTLDDLKKNDAKEPGTLKVGDVSFSYYSEKSELPSGYVILLEPVPDLYAKAFIQEGYMVSALVIVVVTLLVGGFSLYPYIRSNILTPEEEKTYEPARVRSGASLFGVFGLIIIAICGMFSYALNGVYDDVLRGRMCLDLVEDSFSMYTDRYERNMQSFREVYLDYGNLIAEFLDAYSRLRDTEVLSTLAESISASSITLYDSNGRETVSSGRWNGLKLGKDPDSATYDFRRILRGVPSIIHDPQIDEVTGQNEMRVGIQIRDDWAPDRYGVMMLCVDVPALTSREIDPEESVRRILSNLSDAATTLWIADPQTGRVLVSGKEEQEGENTTALGLDESDLKDNLMKTIQAEEGVFFVTSSSMETPGILDWTAASKSVIAYCRKPETPFLGRMVSLTVTGCILFLGIYSFLAWMTLSGYTVDFFNRCKQVKEAGNPEKNMNPIRRAIAQATPSRKGIVVMELLSAFFLLQIVFIVNSNSSAARNTVYYYISAGEWEKGFNLFSIAAIVILLAKTVLIVIGMRFLMAICASFSGSRWRTIFRLLSNVTLYIALIVFLIKTFEYLGFSPAVIAAGMGSVALAISLGAQNFVADVFAGLTFVFEGTVHVGDIVQISASGSPDHRGRIVEVGIRSIKIQTRGGDLITCNNRDIGSIRNRTQMNSLVICELSVSSEIPIDDLEKMLKEELPGIGRMDRQILSGPVFNGVTAIGNGMMTLSVSAECSEENYSYVMDRLNVSLLRIFREHGYSV